MLAQQQQNAGIALADEIWNLAELGYFEYRSSGALQRYLSGNDFKVETGAGGIPTAFVASYRSTGADESDPVIAILAEFDALPGLNQAATPFRSVTQEGGAGHACGHHLFGAASSTAAVALSQWLQANDCGPPLSWWVHRLKKAAPAKSIWPEPGCLMGSMWCCTGTLGMATPHHPRALRRINPADLPSLVERLMRHLRRIADDLP